MTVETASYISQLDTTLPTASDLISEGDDHLRMTKTVLKTQFPNFGTTAISASAAEVNYSVGVTSAIQTQINGKGAIAGQAWTGAHSFAGATSVPTLSAGTNTTGAASTAFVQADFLQKFPNYTAPVNASTTELNYLVGLTGAIQPQLSNQVSGPIHAATAKTTPADADELGITDSAASWGLKKLTFANLKAWIGGLFVSKSGDTMTGPLAQAAGTAGLPSYTFSGDTNTGMWSPAADVLAWSTAGAERLRIGDNGNVGIGVAPTTKLDVNGILKLRRNDAGNEGGEIVFSRASDDAMGWFIDAHGTGSTPNLRISSTTQIVATLGGADSSFLITGGGGLGYGIGSGGTVTQETSKSTSVTLNKPSGKITMNAATLNNGAVVQFVFNNSNIGPNDGLALSLSSLNLTDSSHYRLGWAIDPNSNVAYIGLYNQSGGALSQAVTINFQVIKGATS